MTIEDIFNKIYLLITATEKSEFAYTEIKRLVFKLITFEWYDVAFIDGYICLYIEMCI